MGNQKSNINFFAGMTFFGSYVEDVNKRRLMNEASQNMVTKVAMSEDAFGRPEARIYLGDQFAKIILARDSYVPGPGEYSKEILAGAELRFLHKQGSEELERLWLKAPEEGPKKAVEEAPKASVIEGLFGK